MAYRRTRNVEAKMEHTRASILRAARQVVGDGGLRGSSIADVARTAEVGVGTVYRYFPTKDALLAEVVRETCSHEIALVAKVATEPGTHVDRLLAAVSCFARRASESGRTAYAMIAEPAPAEVELDRIDHRRALADVFAAIVADGVDGGELAPQDPTVTATAIVGAVSEVIVGPLSPARRSPDAEIGRVLDDTLDVVRRAVGAIQPHPDQPIADHPR